MAYDELLEDYPDDLTQSLAQRDAWRRQTADDSPGLEFIVSDISRWTPGSVVRVAFLGGDSVLHEKIAGIVQSISDNSGLTLDLGRDEDGSYRSWSESDTEYQAEIRVGFDMGGFWSLVGTDSIDPSITPPHFGYGGRPNQRSLNLGQFDRRLPADWQRTVLHEFLHALAFKHEHQNMRGPCQQEFRWEDDDGYDPTTEQGRFVADAEGRRPGIYTFLGGEPNNWDRVKVDHNLRSAGAEDGVASVFDPASVMLYRFPPLFYHSDPSECAPHGDGNQLSDGDKRGLELLYPRSAEATEQAVEQVSAVGAELAVLEDEEEMLESIAGPDYVAATRAILDRLSGQS